MEIFLFRS